jgi:hypothetical protein
MNADKFETIQIPGKWFRGEAAFGHTEKMQN